MHVRGREQVNLFSSLEDAESQVQPGHTPFLPRFVVRSVALAREIATPRLAPPSRSLTF